MRRTDDNRRNQCDSSHFGRKAEIDRLASSERSSAYAVSAMTMILRHRLTHVGLGKAANRLSPVQ